ncbi:PH domain-containing protein [Nocardia jejuensis]|uniref:PH domain-containing protein n=1 Tax=Nocardia jejuensis TaxID=328049 RepID=UPI000A050201|nr:PH domain-containing protein [Nocardia jejuensis]
MSSPHQSVPPAQSSHTPDLGSDTGPFPEARFRSDWLWLLGVFIGPLIVVVPLWLLRLQTDLTSTGVETRGLARTRRVPWSEIEGVRVPGFGRVYLRTTDGTEIPLPGVDFARLRALLVAARGRIQDPGVRVIGLTRLAHIAVFMVLMGVIFPFAGLPQVLWILFAIPIAMAVWIERTRTKVSADGLHLRTMFSTRHIDWSEVKGLRIPARGFLRVHLADDSDVSLPAVGYDRLRDLVEASDGRIPDPFVEPEDADEAELVASEVEEPITAEADEHGTTPSERDTSDK